MRSSLLLLLAAALAAPVAVGAVGLVPAGPSANAVAVDMQCVGLSCVFNPPVVAIRAGDTVTWRAVNVCHTATSGAAPQAESAEAAAPAALNLNAFDSGQRCADGVATFSHTFGQSGVYKYYCAVGFHALGGMQGAVVVA